MALVNDSSMAAYDSAGRRSPVAAPNSRASRSPQRSTGADAGGHRLLDGLRRSVTGTATAPTAASASMPSGVTPPPTAMHGLPAACARRATPSAVLPYAVCSSIRPSPVITRSASASASSKPASVHHEVDARAELELREPARRAHSSAKPDAARGAGARRVALPPAGRALEGVGEARRSRRSSADDVAGVAPFCGP